MKTRYWWLGVSVLVISIMALPLATVLWSIFQPVTSAWEHIKKYLLLTYVNQTLLLVFISVFCGIALASALAWFVTAYNFPGRNFLAWALVLPLAVPPYIAGYTYVALTGYTGALQVNLRNFGWTPPPGFFDMQNLTGAIFIFTLFIYPYIYLVIRAFLAKQAKEIIEAAYLLGASRRRAYWKIIFPLTRNAIIAGATLMAFEILSDYGVSSYFGIQVFTTAIFKSWTSFYDVTSAMRLAAILLIVVGIISIGEKSLRGRKSSAYLGSKTTPLERVNLTGKARFTVPLLCWIVFGLGFFIPLLQIIYWAVVSIKNIRLTGLLESTLTSFSLATLSATLTTLIALVIAQNYRLWPTKFSRLLAHFTVIGYSIPSTVIAFSIFSTILWIANTIGINLQITWHFIVFAFIIRYLAVSMQSVEAGFSKLGTRHHEAARLLGRGPLTTTLIIDIPLMKTAITGAFLLAFIDMVKELTIVLILRPFNFSTLSIRVFEYANDEQIPESALASLLIIALALIPVILMVYKRKNPPNPLPSTSQSHPSISKPQSNLSHLKNQTLDDIPAQFP